MYFFSIPSFSSPPLALSRDLGRGLQREFFALVKKSDAARKGKEGKGDGRGRREGRQAGGEEMTVRRERLMRGGGVRWGGGGA